MPERAGRVASGDARRANRSLVIVLALVMAVALTALLGWRERLMQSVSKDSAAHFARPFIALASECLEQVAAALVRVWRDHIPDVRGSRIVDRAIGSSEGVTVPASARAVVLAFDSPPGTRLSPVS